MAVSGGLSGWMAGGTLAKDVRVALRTIRARPGFAATVILTLALGIGANTAAFGLLHALLLRPIAAPEPERLVIAFGGFAGGNPHGRFSYPNYVDIRDRVRTLESFAAFSWATQVNLAVNPAASAERAWAQSVSGNFFRTLGVTLPLGRAFADEEDRTRNTHPVTVVSHRFWQVRLGGDPSVIGRVLRLNGRPFTVIGVAPARMPQVDPPFAPDLWLPMAMLPAAMPGQENKLDSRAQKWLRGLGRLRDDVTLEQAQAELRAIAQGLVQTWPNDNRRLTLTVRPEREARAVTLGTSGRLSWVLVALVGLVLLIACANLANLLLVRSAARARELSVRAALGAGRGRLLQQLLTEQAVLAIAGGLAGLALAAFLSNHLWTFLLPPRIMPAFVDTTNSRTLVLFAIACTTLTVALFGLVPALRATRGDLVSSLKAHGTAAAAPTRGSTLQNLLVISQLALSVVVLISAALFLRSLTTALRLDLGFVAEERVVAGVPLGLQGYTRERANLFQDALLARVRQLPGVQAASSTAFLQLSGGYLWDTSLWPDDEQPDPAVRRPFVIVDVVGAGYFGVMGRPLLRGRDISETDRATTAPVAVVNKLLAETFWPGEDPIGKRFRLGMPGVTEIGPIVEVVGLSVDGQYETLGERPQRRVFLPFAQQPQLSFTVIAHARGPAGDTLAGIAAAVKALDPQVPLTGAQTLRDHVDQSVAQPRMFALFASAFGALALLLAVMGVYGTLSYLVRGRTREIGVRVALGARPAQVLLLVMRRGAILGALGLAAGITAAVFVSRALESMLYGTTRIDGTTTMIVSVVLACSVLLASALPARRALRINLVRALRQE